MVAEARGGLMGRMKGGKGQMGWDGMSKKWARGGRNEYDRMDDGRDGMAWDGMGGINIKGNGQRE